MIRHRQLKFRGDIAILFICLITLGASANSEIIVKAKIHSISESDSSIWVSFGTGIAKINKINNNYSIYDSSNTVFLKPHIYCAVMDKNSVLWIGTQNGIVKYDGVDWTNFLPYPTSNLNEIYALHPNSSGGVWVGSLSLLSFNGVQWNDYHTALIGDDWTYSLAVDSQGSVYTGASCGLMKFSNNTWSIIDSLGHCTEHSILGGISSIALDTNNRIWEAFYSKGLRCITNGYFEEYRPDNSGLPSTSVSSLTIDRDNRLFIGSDSGIVRFADSEWDRLNDLNSLLPCKSVTAMLIDKRGSLWVGTDSGLVVFKTSLGIGSKSQKNRMQSKNTSISVFNRRIFVKIETTQPVFLTLNNLSGKTLWRSGSIFGTGNVLIPNNFSRGIYLIRLNGRINSQSILIRIY